MTTFRNCLVTFGAALGANFVVSAIRWWLLYPLTGLGMAAGSPQSALVWASGVGVLVAILAGIGAGIGLQTGRPVGWSLLLAALVALNSGTSMSRTVFSSTLTHATAEFGVSIIAAIVAFASFHITRNRDTRRAAHASAA